MTPRLVRLVGVVGIVAGTSTLVIGLGLATPTARASSLREDTSPYLVRCADDAIAWRPWGDAAFVEARTTRRPVLVSLGDSFSFDTHERDRRQLADPELVRLVTRRFVPIKVDRKQRPEIETVYRLLSGRAEESEISTALLTADGGPFRFLGLDEERTTDLKAVLTEAADRYDRDPEEAARASRTLLVQARAIPLSKGAGTTAAVSLEADLAEALERVDAKGPDRPASSPPHGLLRLLLDPSVQERSPEAMRSGATLLEALARTSLRDPLGGGFHRGFHDREATRPRFEQLLCDNALLLRAYARTAGLLRNLFLRDVAREIVGWSLREMRDATGVFWSGRSAVGQGEEGAFYVWTREEIVRWLEPDRANEWLGVYRLQPPGLFVLQGSPFAGLGSSREVLMGRRARRVPPPVDDEVLTGWNGLMIGALAVSGQSLNRGSDLEAARRAATVLLDRAGPPERLRRGFRGAEAGPPALLEDYANLAEGLLDLAEATGESRWRTDATALVDAAVLRFWDTSAGGLFETDGRDTHLPLRPKRGRDSELPAANAVMASVMVRIGRLPGQTRYLGLAEKTLAVFARDTQGAPAGSESLLAAAAGLTSAKRAAASAPVPGP